MKIQFISPHLSIDEFEPYDLPDLTVITGVNGSGKTHFLDAILNRKIKIDGINIPQQQRDATNSDVFFANYKNLAQDNFSNVNGNANRYRIFQSQQKELIENLKVGMASVINLKKLSDFLYINEDYEIEYKPSSGVKPQNYHRLFTELNDDFTNRKNIFTSQINNTLNNLFVANELEFKDALNLSWEDILKYPIKYKSKDLFHCQFDQIFADYVKMIEDNKYHKFLISEGVYDQKVLNDEEFLAVHGEPPWNLVNRIFRQAQLGFQINYPEAFSGKPFTPKYIKDSTGISVSPSNLSSGEQILFCFAALIVNSQYIQSDKTKVKLLLLDEVDATLHPTMCKLLMDIITNEVIDNLGVKVIMTTHKPSTIALAPDASIFVKETNNSTLKPILKTKAINILSEGIPTLSIDFQGRRQVFTESNNDVEQYSKLYQIVEKYLDSPFSLSFLSVGFSSKETGDINSGCTRVIDIVKKLREYGNNSIYGIIDWDNKNRSIDKESIKIFKKDIWYSIENFFYDPLVVLVTILRMDSSRVHHHLNIPKSVNCNSLLKLPKEDIQSYIDIVQEKVFSNASIKLSGNYNEVEYMNGLRLKIDKAYGSIRGHDLEDMVHKELPISTDYRKINIGNEKESYVYPNSNKTYISYVLKFTLDENNDCIPKGIVDLFNSLLIK